MEQNTDIIDGMLTSVVQGADGPWSIIIVLDGRSQILLQSKPLLN